MLLRLNWSCITRLHALRFLHSFLTGNSSNTHADLMSSACMTTGTSTRLKTLLPLWLKCNRPSLPIPVSPSIKPRPRHISHSLHRHLHLRLANFLVDATLSV
mmetsp:Transcript_21273/g.66732  ORF Transcript_21273/g.66732 Transcript_21273/m.66732 type:complete len:102 (-) Transcript_21273:29-334(-)